MYVPVSDIIPTNAFNIVCFMNVVYGPGNTTAEADQPSFSHINFHNANNRPKSGTCLICKHDIAVRSCTHCTSLRAATHKNEA